MLDRINLNSNLNIMFWGAEGRVGFEATYIWFLLQPDYKKM